MSKRSSSKKSVNNTFFQMPFTQRTPQFLQKLQECTARKIQQKYALKNMIHQNQNINFNNRHLNSHQKDSKGSKMKNNQTIEWSQKKHGKKDSDKDWRKMIDYCLKQIRCQFEQVNNVDLWQKKIQIIIQMKIESMIKPYIQKCMNQYFYEGKFANDNNHYKNQLDVMAKINNIEKGYDHVLQTYDHFLKIVEVIKDKPTKKQDQPKKKQKQNEMASTINQIKDIKQKLNAIQTQVEQLKSIQNKVAISPAKVSPVLLNYEQNNQYQRQNFNVVIATYNQNFKQIDRKLKQLYAFLT